jgi:carboxypeptidase C (cathepsin A)
VNIYNTIGDCIDGIDGRPTEEGKRRAASPVFARAPVPKKVGGPIECIDEVYQQYINTAAFQTAFHVAPLNWAVCGSNSSFNYDRTMADERLQIYPSIVNAGVRVVIYNGDADACVPLIDSAWWTASMNYTVVNPWHSWQSNGQVGGYAINYKPQAPGAGSFTFASVRAAGHMVPQFQPGFAFTLFKNLISNTPF